MDENFFSQMFQPTEEEKAAWAKAQGAKIEEIDNQYAFVDSLNEDQLEEFLKTMTAIASQEFATKVGTFTEAQLREFSTLTLGLLSSTQELQRMICASWAGYARSMRYTKFGTNPNPLVPKVRDEEFEELASPQEDES